MGVLQMLAAAGYFGALLVLIGCLGWYALRNLFPSQKSFEEAAALVKKSLDADGETLLRLSPRTPILRRAGWLSDRYFVVTYVDAAGRRVRRRCKANPKYGVTWLNFVKR